MTRHERNALRKRRLSDPLNEPEVAALKAAFGPRFDDLVRWTWYWADWATTAIEAWTTLLLTDPDSPNWFVNGANYLLRLAQGMIARASQTKGEPPPNPESGTKPPSLDWAKAVFTVLYLRRKDDLIDPYAFRHLELPLVLVPWSEKETLAALKALKLPDARKEAYRLSRPTNPFFARKSPFARVPAFENELEELLVILSKTLPGQPFEARIMDWFDPANFPHATPEMVLTQVEHLREAWIARYQRPPQEGRTVTRKVDGGFVRITELDPGPSAWREDLTPSK